MQLYEQIERQFDEKMGTGLFSPASESSKKEYKSFLKQSFIKFLESECERLEKSKLELTKDETDNDWFYGFGNNQALSDTISHYQNMIKELQK